MKDMKLRISTWCSAMHETQSPAISWIPMKAIPILLVVVLCPTVTVERQWSLMGTSVTGRVVVADRKAGLRALEAAYRAMVETDRLLTTFRRDSPLMRLNLASAGTKAECGPELCRLLDEVLRASVATGLAFDPTIGTLIDAWDLRGAGRIPSARELALAKSQTGPRLFRIDSRAGTAQKASPAAWIDSGAFGKGVALRKAAAVLREMGIGEALIDMGGQLLAIGPPKGKPPWRISVADPDDRRRSAGIIEIRDGSVATSGSAERFVIAGGERFSHILSPRSGRPAADFGSVTVVCRDPVRADVLSTALFVMGPAEGLAFSTDQTDLGVLFLVRTSKGVRALPNREMDDRFLPGNRTECDLDREGSVTIK